MSADPLREQVLAAHDLQLVRESADQLLHTVRLLDADALAGASLLPGWTRANVVGHLIGNAEGLTRLLHWAAGGEPVHQYADAAARTAPIEAAVGVSPAELTDRLGRAVDVLLVAARALDPEQWPRRVRLGIAGAGREIAAAEVPWRRLVEQEVHAVDLAAGYTPAHWSAELTHRLLAEVAALYLVRDDVPPLDVRAADGNWAAATGDPTGATRVEGPAPALLAWLIGRSAGAGLHVHPGPLPPLPPWF
jgi:maleylpyruvate isomerase